LAVDAGASTTLSGPRLYGKVQLDGRLDVAKYDPDVASSGWVWIRATEISIGATGEINATAMGYRGRVAGGEGHSPNGAGGTPKPATMADPTPLPGGGGAHIGKGGSGLLSGSCQPATDAYGGTAYDDAQSPLALLVMDNAQAGMGSAGGGSHAGAPNPTVDLSGGSGGGVVILEAAKISLLGSIHADGEGFTQSVQGATAGGGAGGTIYLVASDFSFGADSKLSAAGGKGMAKHTVGGSGGGGVIVLAATTRLPSAQVNVSGGESPSTRCSEAKGDDGVFLQIASMCVDADRDGHSSSSCGGDDCNDADPEVHPEKSELCDAIDNDCSGSNNDADDDAMCQKGQICEDDKCADLPPQPTTTTNGADAEPHIQWHGGLCSASFAPRLPRALVSTSLTLWLTLLWRRRARRPR
jgi:hypothetical protein